MLDKAGVTIDQFEILQAHSADTDEYLDARTLNKKLTIQEFIHGQT